MHDGAYWKTHYVVETDADEIEHRAGCVAFSSGGRRLELICFERDAGAPNVLISPGSGGHAYVFAELAYRIHLGGFNVFVMPRHGGATLEQLSLRHHDAAAHITGRFNDRLGLFGEGLGAYATFYLALDQGAHRTRGPVRSIACQNGPAICTERLYHDALLGGSGAALRRRLALPLMKALARVAPRLRVPISLYLDLQEMVDTKPENRRVEAPFVAAFRHDPGFDTRYPLEAVVSLVLAPPPGPLAALTVPTMFVVPARGFAPAYVRDLYRRLPPITKRLVEVDDGVFWMCAHPTTAARVIGGWFAETI